MNIVGLGLYEAYEDPTNSGGATGWDLKVWWVNTMFFEGTMRGMFSILFGAGILLFTGRSENNSGSSVTDLYFRRLLWMLLFGVIHCYLLLWEGEILYSYAIVGMFAFSFRHLKPKQLIIGATSILLVATALSTKDYFQAKNMFESATTAEQKKSKGENLNKEEEHAIEQWNNKVSEMKATPEQVKDEMEARSKGYISIVMHKAPLNEFMQTTFLYRLGFWDILAMMLLGMALFKLGILKAARSTRFYILMAVIGYSIGVTVNYFESSLLISNHFSILSFHKSGMTYNLGRIPTTMGHIAVIMLFIKSAWLPLLQRALAAVGQMAFTNYITTSIICNFIFLGYGFAMFGKLQRHELYYIVAGIWMFQLIASPIWVTYFRFGPLEWAWRSLTYWQKQPFRKPLLTGATELKSAV